MKAMNVVTGVRGAVRVGIAVIAAVLLGGCAQSVARPTEEMSPYLAAHTCATSFYPAHCLSASKF